MEVAVTKLAMICFLLVGVSHIVQPRVWAQFFIDLHRQGEVGSFLNGLLHFPLGVIIVSFHNVWHGCRLWRVTTKRIVKGAEVVSKSRFTDVFVWRQERWQLVAGHSSRIRQ